MATAAAGGDGSSDGSSGLLSSGPIKVWGTFRWKDRFHTFDGRTLRIFKNAEEATAAAVLPSGGADPSLTIDVQTATIAVDTKKDMLFTIDDGAALWHLKSLTAAVRSRPHQYRSEERL